MHSSCWERNCHLSCRTLCSVWGMYISSTVFMLKILFRKKLSSRQWLSLILLTAGCMVKQIDPTVMGSAKSSSTVATPKSASSFHLSINLVFILVQVYFIIYHICSRLVLGQVFGWEVNFSIVSHNSTNVSCLLIYEIMGQ